MDHLISKYPKLNDNIETQILSVRCLEYLKLAKTKLFIETMAFITMFFFKQINAFFNCVF